MHPNVPETQLTVSVGKAAALIDVSKSTLQKNFINTGRLETVLLGSRRLVKVSSLRKLVGEEAA